MIGSELLSGIALATFAASGVFFLKFWKASKDKFFLYFSFACFLLSFERVELLLVAEANQSIRTPLTEASSWVYLIRLLAFSLILWAIIQKNRSKQL